MKIKIFVKILKSGEVWPEDYDIDNGKDPKEWAQELIDKFNATLRPNESPRELVNVEVVNQNTEVLHDHSWKKQNCFTISNGGRSYDIMRCERCGITAKRYGFDSIIRDSPFKGKCYAKCETALAQIEKNRIKKELTQCQNH